MQMCLERREEYLDKEKKLSAIYIMEQPIYNPMLYDYQMERSAKEADLKIKAGQQIPLYQSLKDIRKEQRTNECEKKVNKFSH